MQAGPFVGVRPVYPLSIYLSVVSWVFRQWYISVFVICCLSGFVGFDTRFDNVLGFFCPLFVFGVLKPIYNHFANIYNGVQNSWNLWRSLLGWVTPTTVCCGGGSSYRYAAHAASGSTVPHTPRSTPSVANAAWLMINRRSSRSAVLRLYVNRPA